jgi:hypothetical protein
MRRWLMMHDDKAAAHRDMVSQHYTRSTVSKQRFYAARAGLKRPALWLSLYWSWLLLLLTMRIFRDTLIEQSTNNQLFHFCGVIYGALLESLLKCLRWCKILEQHTCPSFAVQISFQRVLPLHIEKDQGCTICTLLCYAKATTYGIYEQNRSIQFRYPKQCQCSNF